MILEESIPGDIKTILKKKGGAGVDITTLYLNCYIYEGTIGFSNFAGTTNITTIGTLTGTPQAPTATAGITSKNLTTAFVKTLLII